MRPNSGEPYIAAWLSILAVAIAVLVLISLSSGCALLGRAQIENDRRLAVNHLIQSEANLIDGCAGRVPKVCVWPTSWPVTIEISFKQGEPDTTLIKMPAELPGFLIP